MPIGFFPDLPKTGTVVDELARLHSDGCINIWPSTVCCYDRPGEKCAFCSLVAEGTKPVDIPELCAGIKTLMSKLPKCYMLNFSGGTYRNPDFMTVYWCELVKRIREFSDCDITVELAPPTDLRYIEELHESGANAVIFNLEIADPELRKRICPGKSKISYEHYHAAFGKAVGLFGWGQVSSVLIGGIQPKEDIIRECEIMASEGVFPTIMPFRPMDNCGMRNIPSCSVDDLLEMAMKLGEYLHRYDLDFNRQTGCTKCGGCSVENDCYNYLK